MTFTDKRIYIAGSGGMVGSSLMRKLRSLDYELLLAPSSAELDLRNQSAVNKYFDSHKPEVVIVAAAKVGGIMANVKYRADFIYDNLMIEANVIDAAYRHGVEKLIFLGSSCIYPKEAPQPLKEEYLLTGPFESTNEPYAIGKMAGIKLCEGYHLQHGCNFYSLVPCNLYGSHDNFDPVASHVIPALIKKLHLAATEKVEEVVLWGTGKAKREFLYVDDLADAVVFSLGNLNADDLDGLGNSYINIGSGDDLEISELAQMIAGIVGYEGKLYFDPSKPDGMMRKVLDVSRMTARGWVYKTGLSDGLKETYHWYLDKEINRRAQALNL